MNWQEQVKCNIRSIDSLSHYYPAFRVSKEESAEIKEAVERNGVNIPRPYLESLISSITDDKQRGQLKNMVLPRLNSGNQADYGHTLINSHQDNNPIKGLSQMYPDRVLVSPNHSCMNHCLWCFRDKENKSLGQEDLKQIYDYISKNQKIRDVILTGGEPLLTSDARLDEILNNLRKISHIDIIRFHTRAPVVLPSRIDQAFLEMVKKHKRKGKPVYVITQFVHPNELSEQSTEAIYKLTNRGIMVLNQAPILRGINDEQETFNKLNQRLIRYSIKPYYAIAPIVKKGINTRFYVPFKKVEELVNEYSSKYDGLGRPTVIIPIMGKKLTATQLKKNMRRHSLHFRNTKRDI